MSVCGTVIQIEQFFPGRSNTFCCGPTSSFALVQPGRFLGFESALQESCNAVRSWPIGWIVCPTFIDLVPENIAHVTLVGPTRLVAILQFH